MASVNSASCKSKRPSVQAPTPKTCVGRLCINVRGWGFCTKGLLRILVSTHLQWGGPSNSSMTQEVSRRRSMTNNDGLTHKLTDVVQFFILQLVLQCPGILLRKIKAEVCHVLRIEVEESTICKFLPSQGFTRQKMQIVAKQRDKFQCCRYVTELTVYKADMFIFLDETGCNWQNAMRHYAYSWRGQPARTHKLLVRGQHLNSIAFMSVEGILVQ